MIASPNIVINTQTDDVRYFTLMMTYLDRANVSTGTYEECCHWLITDIPVSKRLEIPSVFSPFLKGTDLDKNDYKDKATSYGVGNVIFDYLPPHPTHSRPTIIHRYVFTVWEQSVPQLQIEKKKSLYQLDLTKPTYLQELDLEAQSKLEIKERQDILPTMKFAQDNNLKLAAFGHLKSNWGHQTSQIFTALGILCN